MPVKRGPLVRPKPLPVSSDPGREVPVAPDWMNEDERVEWDALWRSGVGALWDAVLDAPSVARMFLIRREVLLHPALSALHGALSRLESDLGLNPRSRIGAGIELIEPTTPQAPAKPSKGSARDRLQAV